MNTPVYLRRGGVSLVFAYDKQGVPWVVHWGADLGGLTESALLDLARAQTPGISMSAFDHRRVRGLVPTGGDGFAGTPALATARLGAELSAYALPREWTTVVEADSATFTGADPEAGVVVAVEVHLSESGLVRMRTTLTNNADDPLQVAHVLNSLPVGAQATELLDLTGRWCKERSPQRHPWVQGTHLRSARHGRTGHDASLLLIAGTPGFGFSHGEVWGVHTAWSGDHTTYAERTAEGEAVLGGGELLGPGEIRLGVSESYASPWLLGSYATDGMDSMSHRLHDWIRSQSPRTRTPRPIVVNTWEAVYFDHDLEKLTTLADKAAKIGAERFVLDDGWFLSRRSDVAGLGDWTVDPAVWPTGLHPLVNHVTDLGLQFGLWFEPEMINVDSEVARAHPDWILGGHREPPQEWRHQQVIDLQNPDAYAHVRDQMLALLGEYPISYIKWDHNRDLTDATHAGRPAVHGQTLAAYRLLDELHAAHPDLEIESCASGGGRVDAEILRHTDRIWASDTIDALERQILQRWTGLLVPPELIGSHIGGPTAHTTGRSHRLGFRAATALLYHFGIEWNLTSLDSLQRHALGSWVDLHRRIQPHIPSSRLVHTDHPDPAVIGTGLVSADRSVAWYVVATIASTDTQHPSPLRLTGLDPESSYLVTEVTPTADQHGIDLSTWWAADGGATLSGHALATVGIRLPVMAPDTARVIEVRATDASR